MRLPKPIIVLSDGTGETAEKVVRAALQQFKGHLVHVRTQAQVTRPDQVGAWFRVAARQQALVITTLVSETMREEARRCAAEHDVVHLDLISDLLKVLGTYLELEPVEVPGLLHTADETYFRRIEAVEFTIKADDGKDARMLGEAHIVLVGVSRTSKTPLSTYLAHKGFKVGNVPIVLDRPIPDQLFEVDPSRVFALTIEPDCPGRQAAGLAVVTRKSTIHIGVGYERGGNGMAQRVDVQAIMQGRTDVALDAQSRRRGRPDGLKNEGGHDGSDSQHDQDFHQAVACVLLIATPPCQPTNPR